MTTDDAPPGRPSSGYVTANLRVFMALNRESQAEVADVLHISRPSLSSRLHGGTAWQLADVDRLAEHYGTTPGAFLSPPAAALVERAARQLDSRGRRPRVTWSHRRDRRLAEEAAERDEHDQAAAV